MKLMRHPVHLALLAVALTASARMTRAQDAAPSIPDSETRDPPTQDRLQQVENVAAASGWASVAPMLHAAALKAYGQERLAAAAAWYHAYEWTALFSEPEDQFVGGWINA